MDKSIGELTRSSFAQVILSIAISEVRLLSAKIRRWNRLARGVLFITLVSGFVGFVLTMAQVQRGGSIPLYPWMIFIPALHGVGFTALRIAYLRMRVNEYVARSEAAVSRVSETRMGNLRARLEELAREAQAGLKLNYFS